MADSFPKPILPELEGRRGSLVLMRFWSKVDMRGPDECWNWKASRTTSGYGRFKIASYNSVMAHRVSLIATHGIEPPGLLAIHSCDNPPCCNPAHLRFGTVQDNTDDKLKRGRHRNGVQRGSANGAAKLDEQQLALIVTRLKDGWTNKDIAADLPVTHGLVSLIRLGKSWAGEARELGWTPTPQFKGPIYLYDPLTWVTISPI